MLGRTALIICALTLSGCVAPNSGQPDPLTADSFRLFAADAPTQVYAGFPVTFSMQVEGPDASSDHVGAHMWREAPADPTADIGDSTSCQHTRTTALAGNQEVTCTFPEPGNYTLHGHARILQGDEQLNYWSTGRDIVVLEPYTLSVANPPKEAVEGGSRQYLLDVSGGDGISTHLGGHFWADAPADPTASILSGFGCVHPDGQSILPGTFRVTCHFSDAGTFAVFGHMRMELEGRVYDFWAQPFDLVVQPRN